jgi:lipopolysaccharide export system permease protein
VLNDGYHYEELPEKRKSYKQQQNMPATKAHFDEYIVNIDISVMGNMDAKDYKEDREMLSLNQLNYYTDSLKLPYDEFIATKAKNFISRAGFKTMNKDSTNYSLLDKNVLENYDTINKVKVIDNAIAFSKRSIEDVNGFRKLLKNKQKFLNVYNVEFHRRLAFSIACLVLFFIGAPLGSIIRKGGFGFPMIMAIVVFVIYFFISTFGKNMAHSSTITAALGGWLSTIVLLPLGFLLMRRATKDKGIFNIDAFLQPITNFFKKLFKVKESNSIK